LKFLADGWAPIEWILGIFISLVIGDFEEIFSSGS
jgi:hypothetical protein